MATIKSIEELEIWQMSRILAKKIIILTSDNKFDADVGLRRQIRNAAGSVMDNIAEGFGQASKNEFIHHLTIARGSAQEVRSQLYRCFDAKFVAEENFSILIIESEVLVKRISGMISYLTSSTIRGTKFTNRR